MREPSDDDPYVEQRELTDQQRYAIHRARLTGDRVQAKIAEELSKQKRDNGPFAPVIISREDLATLMQAPNYQENGIQEGVLEYLSGLAGRQLTTEQVLEEMRNVDDSAPPTEPDPYAKFLRNCARHYLNPTPLTPPDQEDPSP